MCRFLIKENKEKEINPLCSLSHKKCPYATYCQYIKDVKLKYNWRSCSLYSDYWKGKIIIPEM